MSNKNKKFDKQSQPPPPLFFGQKERNFTKQTQDQLVECVIGQQVIYYPIDVEKTNFHPLYKEAIEKVFLSPLHVYCLVDYAGQATETNNYGIDRVSSHITVHFSKRRLTEDQDIMVREGDFVQYNNEFWEIVELNEPSLMFGQDNYKVEISAKCVRARFENFDGAN